MPCPPLTLTIPAVALVLAAGRLPAGELDPAQDKWFKQYEKQPNVPKPADMLLNKDDEPKVGEKAELLFNGKDLTGWKTRGGESTFEVKDGCIRSVCKPDSPSTYLCTEKEDYADFLLTFETRFVVETNSGVMIRAQAKGTGGNTPGTDADARSTSRKSVQPSGHGRDAIAPMSQITARLVRRSVVPT